MQNHKKQLVPDRVLPPLNILLFLSALWQYIKTHKLQDPNEREFVNCDPFLRQIFQTERMKFAEIPQRLNPLLHPPDPIVINHLITGKNHALKNMKSSF